MNENIHTAAKGRPGLLIQVNQIVHKTVSFHFFLLFHPCTEDYWVLCIKCKKYKNEGVPPLPVFPCQPLFRETIDLMRRKH